MSSKKTTDNENPPSLEGNDINLKSGMKTKRETLDLDNFIPYQVVALSGYFGDQLNIIYERYGISVSEWRVIACTAESRITTAIDIVSRVHLDEVTVHRAVTSLASRRLLRQRQDPSDRRRKLVELTDQGWSIYEKIVPLALKLEDSLLARLTRDERILLVRSLKTLLERLGLVTRGTTSQR